EIVRGTDEGFADSERLRGLEHGVHAVAPGDLTDNGAPDLMLALGGSRERTLAVLLNDGTGAFGEPISAVTGFTVSEPALVDADGDGNIDVLMPASNRLFRNEGSATEPGPFTDGGLVGNLEQNDVYLADVDADGRM